MQIRKEKREMKNIRKFLASVLLALTLCLVVSNFSTIEAQAATKSVKKISYSSTLTSKIKNNATVVKRGTTKLKLGHQGYLRFKAPATKTYSFKFSGQTSSSGNTNNGYAYIMNPVYSSYSKKYTLERLQFSTTGGKATTAWYHTKAYADTEKTTSAFLASRTCKLKLKKGQTVYLYMYFANNGTINLTIK